MTVKQLNKPQREYLAASSYLDAVKLKNGSPEMIEEATQFKENAAKVLCHYTYAQIRNTFKTVECPYCYPDGTVRFPDGPICDNCGGSHEITAQDVADNYRRLVHGAGWIAGADVAMEMEVE